MKRQQVDRREFLKHGGATVAASVIAGHHFGDANLSGAEKKDEFIDAHVHVWTNDLEKYPLAVGYRRASMQPVTFPPETLFQHCHPVGVSRIVLIQMSYYGFDNSYMLDVIGEHPGVFAGVAVIDAEQSELSARMNSLKNHRVTGFRLHPRESTPAFYEKWLASDGIQTMFRGGAKTGQAMCFLVNPNALPQIDQLCERFPDTTVVIDHMARIGVDGNISQHDLDQLLRCARHQRTFVKVSAFYALGQKTPPYTDLADMIWQLRDAFGARRLMWASDSPFQVEPGHTYRESIQLVKSRLDFLSKDDLEWILRGTADNIFFNG